MNKYYSLTKTLILSGIQCEKKLWFDLNEAVTILVEATFVEPKGTLSLLNPKGTAVVGKVSKLEKISYSNVFTFVWIITIKS